MFILILNHPGVIDSRKHQVRGGIRTFESLIILNYQAGTQSAKHTANQTSEKYSSTEFKLSPRFSDS